MLSMEGETDPLEVYLFLTDLYFIPFHFEWMSSHYELDLTFEMRIELEHLAGIEMIIYL